MGTHYSLAIEALEQAKKNAEMQVKHFGNSDLKLEYNRDKLAEWISHLNDTVKVLAIVEIIVE